MTKDKIIIFDKRDIVARGIGSIIQESFKEVTVFYACSEAKLISLLNQHRPEVLIIQKQKLDNINKVIHSKLHNVKIITIGKEPVQYTNLMYSGNITLSTTAKELTAFLEEILNNSQEPQENIEELTAREKEIVRLIALGYTNQQIAEKLFISPHTVITHRKNITSKLGIKTTAGLTIFAILKNLITEDEQQVIINTKKENT